MTIAHPLKDTAATEPTASSTGSPSVAGGGFTRLNPVDGLFLRAEHLALMQQYTSQLAAAVGAGLGPGVAYGFRCILSDNSTIEVGGGLAFADGQPLYSTEKASISLAKLTATDRDFWIIEIVPKTWQFGSEPVYGGLCEDPCGTGSGIRPKEAVGIEVRLRPDVLDQPSGPPLQRNRLASYYFERERRYGGEFESSSNAPWLMPVTTRGTVLDIRRHHWSYGTDAHRYAAVPLGVVWREGSQWNLDTWIARRDLGEPTPAAAWQWRLGWRPRNVFMAQVLQFQAQLAASPYNPARDGVTQEIREMTAKLEGAAAGLRKATNDLQLRSHSDMAGLIETLYKTAELVESHIPLCRKYAISTSSEPSLLWAAGFGELPSAGYLPFELGTQEDMEQRAGRVFGPNVDVRVRVVRADFVAHAVEEAQHMDRIPLDVQQGPPPEIDVLVPDADLGDLPATQPSGNYRWAAFVRRRQEAVRSREDVDVYSMVVREPGEENGLLEKVASGDFSAAELKGLDNVTYYGVVSYPAREWGVPVDVPGNGTSVWQKLQNEVRQRYDFTAVIGVAHTADRQPLAALRGALLVVPQHDVALSRVKVPPVHVGVAPRDWPKESIIVIIGPRFDA